MKHKETWESLVTEFVVMKEARRDRQTTAWYRARLGHFVTFAVGRKLKPKQVRTADLDAFVGEMKTAGYAYRTRKGTLTALKTFFKWLRRQRAMKRDPFAEFEPLAKERDVTQPIPLSHAYRMIKAAEADGGLAGLRDAAIMRLLLTTGARRVEIVRLTLDEVNLDAGQIKLLGKYNHRRWGYLKPTTQTALRRWLAVRPKTETPALFVSLRPHGQGPYETLKPNALNDLLVAWRDRAKVPATVSVSPHKWRHRFATEMSLARDPFALKDLLGHSELSTTDGYVHSHPDTLRDLVLRYAPDLPIDPEK
jgi:site-specific recombinase XerD